MLDDLKMIHERDAQDALGIAERQGAQLAQDCTITRPQTFQGIQTVVYGAMGGSALAALLLHTWPSLQVPFEVVRDYDVPAYISERTLFIAASYSGNTEETLSAIEQAAAKGAQIVVIAGGGKLQAIAEAKGYMFVALPKAEQPRYAVLYNFRALLQVLQAAQLVSATEYEPTFARTASFLTEQAAAWRPEVPTAQNMAKQIAQELVGKSVVIYGGPKLFPAAYKWKISCNENAKHIAWVNQFPEFNHNEFIGWSKQPIDKPYAVVDLRSDLEHPRIQKRFEVTERLLSGMRPSPIVVQAVGEDILSQMLWTVLLGDFVTIYLALLNGVNPAPVDLVEKFKKALDE